MTKIIDEGIVVCHNTHDAIKADNISFSYYEGEQIIYVIRKKLMQDWFRFILQFPLDAVSC